MHWEVLFVGSYLIAVVALCVVFVAYRSNFLNKRRGPRVSQNATDIIQLPKCAVTFHAIVDEFVNLKEVTCAIRKAGLEKCQLILGVDFTASNEWQGRRTFSHKSLHALSEKVEHRHGRRGSMHRSGMFRDNPYQKVISILGQTLGPFDDDNLIPAFGFGDSVTKDKSLFSLTGKMEKPCLGFQDVLAHYKEAARRITMSGPTNFVPIINKSVEIVRRTGEYHILIIIADGQIDPQHDLETRKAIISASWYPLSIILVGVGDGPWEVMNQYDDRLPGRQFDNFQFVDYHSVIRKVWRPELSFAVHALMEIPDQYKAIRALGMLKT